MTGATDMIGPVSAGALAKKRINRALRRATGYELRRRPPGVPDDPARRLETPPVPPDPEQVAALGQRRLGPFDRLVTAPTFILSSVRSGSTLLRLVLNSHPEICSPHELHLRRIEVHTLGHGRFAMAALGLDEREVRNLLWDRILHRELRRSGKARFVNKTPTDSLMWFDILACWPDARFIFLHRHPAAIVDSWAAARPALTRDEVALDVYAYVTGMEQARRMHGGLVVRYEDLTTDPETVTQRICDFVGVAWEPAMIDYGKGEHRGRRRGLGDWSGKMRSGVIHPAAPTPPAQRIPPALRPVARAWGYLPTTADRFSEQGDSEWR
jgi:hypothetical protein